MITSTEFDSLKARCKHVLRKDLGLAHFKVDENGDFRFRFERRNVVLIFDATDPSFLWLRMPYIYYSPEADAAHNAVVERAMNAANLHCKMVKVARGVQPDADGDLVVSAGIGFLANDVAAIDADTLERYLFQLKSGVATFHEAIASSGDEAREELAPAVTVPRNASVH